MSDERSANAVDKRLGSRVRVRRLELGMSQEHLADLLGVTFQQVQKYEKGVNRMAASRLYDVANSLEMSIADFFDDFPPKKGASPNGAARLDTALDSPQLLELVRLYKTIRSPSLRKRVLDLVRTVVDEST